jgi:hypothetical protein
VSDFNVELEERLRALSSTFKEGVEPPATLHNSVMTGTVAHPVRRRPALARELTLAAALVVFVALVAFGFSKLHTITRAPVSPSPRPTANAIPWTPAAMVLSSTSAQLGTPAEAAQWIGHTAATLDPLLLPAAIGDDYQAEFMVDQQSFSVVYASPTRRATVELASSQPVMPSPGSHGRRSAPQFRGVTATYQVDSAARTAPRWLFWNETGSGQKVAYSLIADGLLESDFWQVANSLQPLTVNAGIRACSAADLRAVSGHGNGASGQTFNQVLISNHSASPCTLQGTPKVILRTSAARSIQLQQIDMSVPWQHTPHGPALMAPNSPAPQPESIQAGFGQASLLYSMWDCPANPPISSVMIVLSNGRGTLTLPGDGVGYSWGGECEGAVIQRMEVAPFLASEPQPTYADRSPLSINIKLPDHVRAGQSLHYEVVLTNRSGAPFRFHDCPSYTEDASRQGKKNLANYQLNCSSVGWLGPDESVTFAMVLDIPADTPPGTGSLRWEMRSAFGRADGSVALTVTTT